MLGKRRILLIIILLVLGLVNNVNIYSQEKKNKKQQKTVKKNKMPSLIDSTGAFDFSAVLDDPMGVMPYPIIITQPAVGYGGGLALIHFHKQKKQYPDVKAPPSISGVAGFGTQNKTWMAALFHFHVWGADKVRYIGAVAKPDVHIKYYGNDNNFLSKHPVQFNLNSWAVYQRAQVRIGDTKLWLGGSYIFFQGKTSIDTIPGRPIENKLIEKLKGKTTISAIQPQIKWDSKDNIFTPKKGINAGVQYTYNATWLGADDNYSTINPYFLGYQPISHKVFSAWRFDSNFLIGDAPFYAYPFVQLRGVPSMKYQSNNTMLVETEWKFNVYKRWSLDVFTGTAKAFTSFENFGPATWVYNYGVGFRYLIAKKYGMDAGVDFAFSNNGDFAFSIVFGTAWNK